MAESVPLRCPVCRREHTYTPPSYPCACGAHVTLPLRRDGTPVPVEHRTWAGSWVTVQCASCGEEEQWPRPELGCSCGTTLQLPLDRTRFAAPESQAPAPEPQPAAVRPLLPPKPRPAFRPITIRTAQDARTAAAQYLRWLGFPEVRMTDKRPASGVDVRGPGVVGHVDPTTSPTALRDIETLWLNGLNEGAVAVCFSLAGYAREARARADELGVPLFVLDLTGTPQPVNDPADDLLRA